MKTAIYAIFLSVLVFVFFGCSSAFASEEVYYLHQDHLGSTAIITNSSQEVVSQSNYYPYGSIRNKQQVIGNNLTEKGYTGQISDEDQTDLYYYNARYYNANIGKFTQPDKGNEDLNRYEYVSGNPVNMVDPEGFSGRHFNKYFSIYYDEFLKKSGIPTEIRTSSLYPNGYAPDAIPSPDGGVIWNRNAEYMPLNPNDLPDEMSDINRDEYVRIINYLNVDDPNNMRYKRNKDITYCNIFAWDVATSYRVNGVSAPLPRWYEGKKTDANFLYSWFSKDEAKNLGWMNVSASEAQRWANQGYLTFGVRAIKGGHGHIFVVVPGVGIFVDGIFYPSTAQAGAENWGPESGYTDYDSNQSGDIYVKTQYYVWNPFLPEGDQNKKKTIGYSGGYSGKWYAI